MSVNSDQIVVGVIDVGSPKKGNLGWAVIFQEQIHTGKNLDEFVECFASLAKGRPAALGFEAPMFVPLRSDFKALTLSRPGEGNRPWSVNSGAHVTAIGMPIMCFTLLGLRERLPDKRAMLDWNNWPNEDSLLLFEAFISGANHSKGEGEHMNDARTGARGFLEAYPDLDAHNAVTCDHSLSLVGACLARTGWDNGNTNLLEQSCVVIRPEKIAEH